MSAESCRNLPDRLHPIHGKENPAFLGNLADLRNGVDDPDFVVGIHDGDEDGGRLDGRLDILETDAAIARDREIAHLKTMLFQVLAGIQYGLVFDRLGDDVIALLTEHFRDALDHQVVGFRGAAGENDLFRGGVDECGNLLARVLDGFLTGWRHCRTFP